MTLAYRKLRMAEPLRVLISSIAIDLNDHRKAVEDAILRLKHLPIGMEHFGAIARPPLEVCREKVLSSDVVFGSEQSGLRRRFPLSLKVM